MNTRQELQAAFEPYRFEVEEIEQNIAETRRLEDVPGYIASGAECDVVRLKNNGLVAKIPFTNEEVDKAGQTEIINNAVDAYIPGLGVAGLEQIVAFSPAGPPAMICRHVKGETLQELEGVTREQITADHFSNLIETLKAMQDKRLATDETASNFFWTQQEGFTVIDYELDLRGQQSLVQKAASFARHVLLCHLPRSSSVPEYALEFRQLCARQIGQKALHAINFNWREHQLIFPP